ncbi:hypothetical protein L6164_027935 [Bauhinia variegata]|uniref:Uncharacterized protein n=1 Tax=Bauhinia variegata TaxID=167791 RepID=A0ACB9LVV9_BAUVA|nr:hypothetical protein L6164_027935 [Bauhinia variegata]
MRKKAGDMSMTKNKVGKESKLMRYVKAPMRFLIKARDLYVDSMRQCSTNLAYYDAAMGCPNAGAPLVTTLPRSFSVGSTRSTYHTDDFKELVRAASVRSCGNRIGSPASAKKSPNTVPRSHSVGIGRIDEDKPCDFGDDVKVNTSIFPRSRSYAHHKRTRML